MRRVEAVVGAGVFQMQGRVQQASAAQSMWRRFG